MILHLATPSLRAVRSSLPALFAALAVPIVSGVAAAQGPVVSAGGDQTLAAGATSTTLAGSATNLTPLDFWMADGDHATEDMLLEYDSATGLVAVGKLRDANGKIYGWPADFQAINGLVYGFDVFQKKLYTVDGSTGLCSPIGSSLGYSSVYGLAYDALHDVLYGVDQKSRKVFKLDRASGKATVVLTLPSKHSDVHGLAYRASDNLLYYTDHKTAAIYKVDPNQPKLAPTLVVATGENANVLLDEIDWYSDRLFGSLRTYDPKTKLWSAQLVEIDPVKATSKAWGPVIPDCSAHSLLIRSLPETVAWVQVDGPAAATFADASNPTSAVSFPTAGTYVLELRAIGTTTTTSSQVTIVVP